MRSILMLRGTPILAVSRAATRIVLRRDAFRSTTASYQLACNDNTAPSFTWWHQGFDRCVWQAWPDGDSKLDLTLTSVDGDGGYPGQLHVRTRYELMSDNRVQVSFSATTDAPTIVNLTNHSYFNLAGDATSDLAMRNHTLHSPATHIVPVDQAGIPLGGLTSSQTRRLMPAPRFASVIAWRWITNNSVIPMVLTIITWSVTGKEPTPRFAASLRWKQRKLELWTTEPGFQFYTGNAMPAVLTGKGGQRYVRRGAICLEPQLHLTVPINRVFHRRCLFARVSGTNTTVNGVSAAYPKYSQ